MPAAPTAGNGTGLQTHGADRGCGPERAAPTMGQAPTKPRRPSRDPQRYCQMHTCMCVCVCLSMGGVVALRRPPLAPERSRSDAANALSQQRLSAALGKHFKCGVKRQPPESVQPFGVSKGGGHLCTRSSRADGPEKKRQDPVPLHGATCAQVNGSVELKRCGACPNLPHTL